MLYLGAKRSLLFTRGTNSLYPMQFLPTLPINLVSVAGPLSVVINPNDAITAALLYNAAIANAGTYYVKPSTGNDTTGTGTSGAPFATVAKAMKTATGAASRVVMLEDCVIPSFDLRSTDASQTTQQFKWLDANGFNVVIRDAGPDLAAQTWTRDGTNTNCFSATLPVVSSQEPTRLLRTDLSDPVTPTILSALGGIAPARQFRKYTSAALLNAAEGDGMYWDNTAKVLWVKIGAGEDVAAQKSILKCIYLASSGTSRILLYGASLGLSGVTLEGVQFVLLDKDGRRSEMWLHNCKQMWAVSKGCDMTQAGWHVATDHVCYASEADSVNAFAKSSTGKGLILTARCSYIRPGDRNVFVLNGTLQGISAHGGSHHVSFGTQAIECNGQGVADTCAANESDVTWLAGCRAVGGAAGVVSASYEFGSAATSARRDVYLDNCDSLLAYSVDLSASTNSSIRTRASSFPSISGSVQPYSG